MAADPQKPLKNELFSSLQALSDRIQEIFKKCNYLNLSRMGA
ncbi:MULTISPECIES: hypothetical protein [unclassified Calothrix]|nr:MULTISPECIES: hypothetical protein [unclassified Calothrix]